MCRSLLFLCSLLSLPGRVSGADVAFEAGACGTLVATPGGIQVDRQAAREWDRLIAGFLGETALTPALSVAIVKDDRIVYARGFGYRDLSTCAPADADTRYYLKSTTKSFLGMGAALLHQEGAIMLDKPIGEYVPELDPPGEVSATLVSVRDHFTHTQPYFDSGLNYRTAFPGNLPEAEYVTHINTYSQIGDIEFRYSNFGPIVGAYAITRATGLGWRELIAERIFAPAGMADSFTSMERAEDGPMATAYLMPHGVEFVPTLTKTDAMMHPAGGAVSTVSDLGRWLILNLNQGRIDGRQAIPRRVVEHAHARQVYLDWDFLDIHRFAHGLGVYSGDYEGDLIMHHFGGETHVSFMPEHGLGIAILTNAIADGVRVTHRLALTLYDQMLGKDDVAERRRDRVEQIRQSKARFLDRKMAYIAQLEERAPDGPATVLDLEGDYRSDRLGTMTIEPGGQGRVRVRFGALSAELEHLGGDAYRVDLDPWESMPPQVFIFRDADANERILDWGGRIFVRVSK